jgi:rhamnosyltransferase
MKIYAIVVCYYPDLPSVSRLCRALRSGGCTVVLVDNTEESRLSGAVPDVDIIALGANTGIAHGLNVGIEHALRHGAEIVIYFDQDSEIEDDFIPSLLAPLQPGVPGVVSPVCVDKSKGDELPSQCLNRFGLLVKEYRRNRTLPYNVDVVVTSGTATTAVTCEIAGLMDDNLFIDSVDTEWCLRCRSKGIPILVVPAATMKHSVGINTIDLGFMKVLVHPPLRCYYQIRNCFVLLRKRHVPLATAVREMCGIFAHRFVLLFFVKQKWVYVRNYCLAIMHGVRGIVGKKLTA